VYPNGRVCISILHPPGEDEMSGELAGERWMPTQTVGTILLSVISMLNDPNTSSPANVDASKQWRDDREGFFRKCQQLVKKANKELPEGVVIPHPDTNPEEKQKLLQQQKAEEEFDLYDDPSSDEFIQDSDDSNEVISAFYDSDEEPIDEDAIFADSPRESDEEEKSESETIKKNESKEESKPEPEIKPESEPKSESKKKESSEPESPKSEKDTKKEPEPEPVKEEIKQELATHEDKQPSAAPSSSSKKGKKSRDCSLM